MSYARFYQHGVKAFFEGRALRLNPHNGATHPHAHEGWTNGWLDACHAHGRKLSSDSPRSAHAIRIDRTLAGQSQAH